VTRKTVNKLKISFVTSKEANKYVEEQLCRYIAKKLLENVTFRKEIGIEAEEPLEQEKIVERKIAEC